MIEGLESKKNILKEIMDMMDMKDGERLKKHPKFMKAEIEVEAKPEGEAEEMAEPKAEEKEDIAEGEMEIDPEMLQMLIEKLKA